MKIDLPEHEIAEFCRRWNVSEFALFGSVLRDETAARTVQALVEGFDLEAFRTDVRTHSAVFYQLAVVGEATKKLSPAFRESITEIPWRRIAGMRDILIHGYRGVSPTEAWKAATISIPELLAAPAPVLPAIDLHE